MADSEIGVRELHLALKPWQDHEPSSPGGSEHSPGRRRVPHGAGPRAADGQPRTPGSDGKLPQPLQGSKGFLRILKMAATDGETEDRPRTSALS